ncbi:unnamed protein product [Clonostachys byssicola]|uniref:Uncharacterized protein n=1 Tax=Clonostachys byssicola TaxID=160290 RepID=A0A9N9UVK1_9HYPO|nr:unnamed protein product [Clonostachys byssicola]
MVSFTLDPVHRACAGQRRPVLKRLGVQLVDYVWTRKLDGRVRVWFNDYPKKPTWREGGGIAEGVGTSGANIKYAKLTTSGRADYVAINPEQGSIAAWLNGCANPDINLDTPDPSKNEKMCYNSGQMSEYEKIEGAAESFCRNLSDDKRGPVFSDFYKEAKKPVLGNYHFIVAFEVFEGCKWTFSHDECMRYFKVPMDSCNCSKRGDKQGGTVKNNCIYARIDPNYGI